ncbi:unnamed protein product [Adineta steineri]|uniref:Uncharacterized protein n=1 Tax=Adineta steineri TaxID=433720 RepID=A0A818T5N1_9BILA|nr:unnamed protein product [Adineta steineri]CAF1066496.1 unnamed protein product [Adineta steineri]CAF3682109.1 unnamed protein product [Adineta steineri]CAF3815373.1 unnamed protein product [Adineta steineri]
MFHKYNSFTNTLSPSDQISAFVPQSFGTKEATNNFFLAPQPKGRQPGGSGPDSKGSLAGRQMSLFRFFSKNTGASGSAIAATAQSVAATAQSVASTATQAVANASHAATQAVASTASQAVASATHAATQAVQQHGTSHAAKSHGHGHDSHAAPWEGVNLWRTPYKGDTDTITQVKRNKGTLDRFVETRTRRIQELQLFALRNKTRPTWVMMPRDKIIFAAQGLIAAYVIFQVTTKVYQHLKAKDRLKLIKLLYKDNVD